MGLKRSVVKCYFKFRLPRKRWHIISVLPKLRLIEVKNSTRDVKDIYYRGKFIARTKPLLNLKNLMQKNCFIIATGPSIKTLDLNKLHHYCLFGVNGAAALIATQHLKFTLYIVVDPSFAKYHLSLIKDAIDSGAHCLFSYKVIKTICDQNSALLRKGSIYLIQEVNKRYDDVRLPATHFYSRIKNEASFILHPTQKPQTTTVGFSRNIELGVFDGGTVTFWATQIAYYISFQNIFILGMDLGGTTNNTGRFYETRDSEQPSYLSDDYEIAIKPAFESLATLLTQESTCVYNVSLGSRLPENILPKLNLDSALELAEQATFVT